MFEGQPIEVRYATCLRDTAGNPAHAATWLRRRLVILDRELLRNPGEHRRILVHELFHFVWLRLGNPSRLEWEHLLKEEWRQGARGETGWSAEWRKQNLTARDVRQRSVNWRAYCCESFCDTAATLYAIPRDGNHPENTLAARWQRRRASWFRNAPACFRV